MSRRCPPQRWRPTASPLWFLPALLFLVSCRSVEGTRGIPPFYESYDSPSSDDWQPDVEGKETFVRPFGSLERLRGEQTRLRILYPFGDFRWGPEENRYQLLPVFRHLSRVKLPEGRDTDTMIFPLFFWGSDPEEGEYFAFFPFGGRLKGLLAQDTIDFVVFPIWLRMRSGERVSTHVVWPLINTISGEGWSGGRVWPFYGGYEWVAEDGNPRSQRSFVMWPFYIRNREHLNRDPTEIFFTFPFYGSRENSTSVTRTYLWPFYVYNFRKKEQKSLHGGYLFPYRFTEGQADYWPFFGTKRISVEDEPGSVPRRRFRQFALWPIQRYDWREDIHEETERLWVLPFYFDFLTLDKRTLETNRRWKLWPLVGYHRFGERVAVDILSPLFFRRRLEREVYERLYGRLFALFRYRARPEYSGWELAYGTLYWESTPAGALFSMLGGFLELGRKDGSWVVRLLYIPWW